MTRPASRLVMVALLGALALAGCSAGSSEAGEASAPASEASSLTVVMTDAGHGVAVWPSGREWLVLRTTDGWQHVENVTPRAVPTGGGTAPSSSTWRTSPADLTVSAIRTSPPSQRSVPVSPGWPPPRA